MKIGGKLFDEMTVRGCTVWLRSGPQTCSGMTKSTAKKGYVIKVHDMTKHGDLLNIEGGRKKMASQANSLNNPFREKA